MADPAALNSPPDTLAVARLMRPQGRRGELLAEPLSNVEGLFVANRLFYLGVATASDRTVLLQHCWRPHGRNAGRLVLQLAGVDSISAAEQLVGQHLFLDERELPARDDDTYLVRDLVGCTVTDRGTPVGTVLDLQFPVAPDGHTRHPDAVDLLVVQPSDGGDPVLVPFVKAWIQRVDLSAKLLEMELPPGLFEVGEDQGIPLT